MLTNFREDLFNLWLKNSLGPPNPGASHSKETCVSILLRKRRAVIRGGQPHDCNDVLFKGHGMFSHEYIYKFIIKIYVCIYIYMYVCMSVCMYVCMDGWMYVCMYIYIHTHIYILCKFIFLYMSDEVIQI